MKKANLSKAIKIVKDAVHAGHASLLETEAEQVAGVFGIEIATGGLTQNENQAVSLARKIGYPVVLKIVSYDILHKSDIGCVKTDVDSDSKVKKAFKEIIHNAGKAGRNIDISGVYVQEMLSAKHEFVVGGIRDPQFGPAVMFGMGGINLELYKDVVFRIAPVSISEALKMIHEIKAAPVLSGFRGSGQLDVGAVATVLRNVGKMLKQIDEIQSIDINPLLVFEKGCKAVDLRIMLAMKPKNRNL